MDAAQLDGLLQRIDQGDEAAADRLLPLVYQDLRRLAALRMRREPPGQTLQPTALVHEAWLRIGADKQPAWKNQAQFFAAAAEAMRRILVDRARRRQSRKAGGGQQRVDLADIENSALTADVSVLRVNDALEKLAAEEPEKAELVRLRYFVGLSLEESAAILGIAEPTARRWCTYSRAWLLKEIRATGR